MSKFLYNPIKNDQTALYSSGGGGGGTSVTLNNTYPPVFDNTGVSDTTAATTTVAQQIYALANNAIPSNSASFATTTGSVVQLGNATSGVKVGTAVVPSGASGGYTAISEAGKDVYMQGVKNPVVFGGSITDDVTNINGMTFPKTMVMRAWTPFTITSNALPVFTVNAMGTAGTLIFDILKNGTSIYTAAKPQLAFLATAVSSKFTTDGTQAGNSKGTLAAATTTFAQGDQITFQITSFTSPTGTWTGAKEFIVIA